MDVPDAALPLFDNTPLDQEALRVGVMGDGELEAEPVEATPRGPGRPTILITTDEHIVNRQAIDALGRNRAVYQRANRLVAVYRDKAPAKGVLRAVGTPWIAPVPPAKLRELMAESALWFKARKTRGEQAEAVQAHPPDWSVAAVAAGGEYPGILPLEGVVETPVLRPDGTILDRPGYDEGTALLFEPAGHFLAVPDQPTRDDARAAAAELLRLVSDFPFAACPDQHPDQSPHRAAWLAAALTPLARFAIAGPCPLFALDANAPGSGKTLLCDVIAVLATGRPMPRTAYPDDDAEQRKRITSVALAGDRVMLFDNVATTFGGPAMDAALTATTWRDRVLGRSEMTAELPLLTVWFATGNNLAFRGDAVRRIVPCRLESGEERPEERTGFAIDEPLLAYVQRERPRLVVAALTILRAYVAAGRPELGLTPFGSFEAWSDLVRSTVAWTIGVDPCETRKGLLDSDPETVARTALVNAWDGLPGSRRGLTVAEAIRTVKSDPERYAALRNVLMEWSRTDDLPNPCVVGNRLKAIRGRVCGGKSLESRTEDNTQVWRVLVAHQEGAAGAAGAVSNTSRANSSEWNRDIGNRGWKQPPQPPQPPPDHDREAFEL